jgi:hypothetical protein
MAATEDIRDIFSILHDGTISAWTGNKSLMTLTVDCRYLAERIDKSFDKFYVELSNIDKIELDPWTNPVALSAVINQHDTELDYSGGNLTISCQAIKIFDQNKNELTVDQFDEICKNYWDEWSKK